MRDLTVTGVQTCALPIWCLARERRRWPRPADRKTVQPRGRCHGVGASVSSWFPYYWTYKVSRTCGEPQDLSGKGAVVQLVRGATLSSLRLLSDRKSTRLNSSHSQIS